MTKKKEPSAAVQTADLETILARDIGSVSAFQVRVVLLCALACVLAAFSTNEFVFTTGRINTRCFIPECEGPEQAEFGPPWWLANAVPSTDSGFESCQRFANASSGADNEAGVCPATLFDQQTVVSCEQRVYANTNTAVYDLDLGCSEWLRSLLGSARTAGAMLSLPLAGAVSDRWGRRTALAIISFNTAFIGVMRYFVDTYIGFIISVFTEAFLGAGAILAVSYIFAVETVRTKYRLITGAFLMSMGPLGQITVGVLAWLIPNWRHLTLALYAPQLLTITYFWIFPESVRWTLSKGHYTQAENILKQIAKSSGKELSEKTLSELRQGGKIAEKQSEEKFEREPWLVALVFQHRPILLRCLVTPVWWITVVLIFYGLGINAVNISGNPYLNFIIVAAVDIPGIWCGNFLLTYIGRKPVLMMFYWICSLCQIGYIFLPKDLYALSLTVYLIGKFSISAVGGILYVYTSELFPTRYRNRLFGYASMTGRIGSIVAPFTPALGVLVWEGLPFAIFAALAFLSGLLFTLTPETRGCALPDTMEEASRMGKRHKQNLKEEPSVSRL